MDFKTKSDMMQLSKVAQHWYRRHDQDRCNMRELIADFAGGDYAKNNGMHVNNKTLINLLQLMVVSLSTSLAYNRPRVKMITDVQTNLQFNKRLQFTMNKRVEQLCMEKVLRKIVLDSIFYMGIGKTGGVEPIERVSPDDFVYDAGQGDIRKASMIGDRYRISVRKAQKDERFDKRKVDQLKPTTKSDREDISGLTASIAGDNDEEGELEPMVDLADMWVEAEEKVFTFRCLSKFALDTDLGPLGDGVDWGVSKTGCYRTLTMLEVPSNADPLPLASSVHDLFRIINILLFKMTSRAKKMRDIPIYKPGAVDTMQRASLAGDLQPICGNKEDVGIIKLFGIDQQLQGFIYSLIEIFKQGAGNLDAMVGLSPSADTLGQSQMVAGQVGARIANYRNLTNEFVTEVMGDVCDDLWHSPDLVVHGTGTVPNAKHYSYDNTWWPQSVMPRQGRRSDYKPGVEPYSMEYTTPAMRWAKFKEGLTTIAPFYPAGQAQGVQFDFKELTEITADLLDTPSFTSLFRIGAFPGPEQSEQGGVENNQPHEYIRRSVSGGPDANGAMQQLMQGQSQGGETEQAAMSVE